MCLVRWLALLAVVRRLRGAQLLVIVLALSFLLVLKNVKSNELAIRWTMRWRVEDSCPPGFVLGKAMDGSTASITCTIVSYTGREVWV